MAINWPGERLFVKCPLLRNFNEKHSPSAANKNKTCSLKDQAFSSESLSIKSYVTPPQEKWSANKRHIETLK